MLKAPAHLPELLALMSVFPDAEVVWLHRPVADMLPSTASLFAVHRSTRSDEVDPLEIGRFVTDQFDFFMTRGTGSTSGARTDLRPALPGSVGRPRFSSGRAV